MKRLAAIGLVGIFLGAATIAVWASIADAPWEESSKTADTAPSPRPPAFTKEEVLELTGRAIAEQGRLRPNTDSVACIDADYRPGNQMWVVDCEFRAYRAYLNESVSVATAIFTFEDQTGRLGD